jgi:N-acetylneuraminic acid mutarotase
MPICHDRMHAHLQVHVHVHVYSVCANRQITPKRHYHTRHRYNPATNKWTNLKPMPWGLGHIGAACVPYANGILVAGGRANDNKGYHPNRLMFYDPVSQIFAHLCAKP